VSMSSYSASTTHIWKNSVSSPTKAAALAEIVNLPEKFVSSNPFFVVAQTDWIVWYVCNGVTFRRIFLMFHSRYLLIWSSTAVAEAPGSNPRMVEHIPFVRLDPKHKLTLANASIQIPDPSHQIQKVITMRKAEKFDEDYDDEDTAVFEGRTQSNSQPRVIEASDNECDYGNEDDHEISAAFIDKGKSKASDAAGATFRIVDDWKHDPEWVNASIVHLMPPPVEATPMATMALQRELKTTLNDQKQARSLKELGWYMPPELVGDNLFQWIVELHSFELDLPIAKDMAQKGLNSLIFEIRFPPSYPHSPPFFRIITPRFLPFIQVSIVLLSAIIVVTQSTSTGWGWSYYGRCVVPAVLAPIRSQPSNLP
jgi:ubiquitin-conjugating enzyme E2 Q